MRKLSRTCIAAGKNRRGKIIMAGDRRVSTGWDFAYESPVPKITKKKNGMLIGASGDSGLCNLIIEVGEPPIVETSIPTYMYFNFIPFLAKLIKTQPGYINEHKNLCIGADEACSLLIAIQGELWTVDVHSLATSGLDHLVSRITPDYAPIPFAIGCGTGSAYSYLFDKQQEQGYHTKEQLIRAVEIACDVSPGCGRPIDILQED